MTPMNDRYTKVGNYYVRRPQATPAKQGWTRGEIAKGVLGGLALALVYVAIPWTVYLWMVR